MIKTIFALLIIFYPFYLFSEERDKYTYVCNMKNLINIDDMHNLNQYKLDTFIFKIKLDELNFLGDEGYFREGFSMDVDFYISKDYFRAISAYGRMDYDSGFFQFAHLVDKEIVVVTADCSVY